jgi:hypothetical protein
MTFIRYDSGSGFIPEDISIRRANFSVRLSSQGSAWCAP